MSRAHAALGGAVLAALLMLMLGGCSVAVGEDMPNAANALGCFTGVALALAVASLLFGGWRDGHPPAAGFLVVAILFTVG